MKKVLLFCVGYVASAYKVLKFGKDETDIKKIMDTTYSVFLVHDDTDRGKTMVPVFTDAAAKLKEMDNKSEKDKALIRSISFTSTQWGLDKDFITEFFKPIEERAEGSDPREHKSWTDVVIVSTTGVKGKDSKVAFRPLAFKLNYELD